MKINLDDSLFQAALPLLKQIESHGYEAYFVGGCVRDTLLGQSIHDIDIATSARPDEIQQIFPVTIDVAKEHGTIIVLHHQIPYEITTFRSEGDYSDFRRPDHVDFVRNLSEDTLRRDFTINALAINYQGQLFDYHGGQADLEARQIKAVGQPIERFNEDALRMMRAIRFASQLGFTIEPKTFEAIQELAPLLSHISIERIRIELTKFFQGPYFYRQHHLLVQSFLSQYMNLAEIPHLSEVLSQMGQQLEPLAKANTERDERLCWALLLHNGFKSHRISERTFLRNWTHSNQFIQDVLVLIELLEMMPSQPLTAWQLYSYPTSLMIIVQSYLQYHHRDLNSRPVEELVRDLPIQDRSQLAVNGKDIMSFLEMKRGSAIVGQWLDEIEKLIVQGQLLNDYQTIKNYISCHKN
ncbi:CCA tRNA nucleotidyltransferase [Vaginisenegalia massiliensis]|uniref:CCA tRNA nucleotidyltransferase n=1 Tax=Vaginisenegalia massiliensis TaxID=2058294 RepID=UPI000F52E094|nr:CCA tRNA nucleotidyltransferase [Vaginisenegalia massiliensis]